jgi:hypothetical protein
MRCTCASGAFGAPAGAQAADSARPAQDKRTENLFIENPLVDPSNIRLNKPCYLKTIVGLPDSPDLIGT